MTTTPTEELIAHFERLMPDQQDAVLNLVKTFAGTESEEEWTEEEIIQYNKEIDEAEAEFQRGEYVTLENLFSRKPTNA